MTADPLRGQYEAYPYPTRRPGDPDFARPRTVVNDLRTIGHYLFRGRRDFTRPFRALVAGGGTGDATVHLGYQLAELGAPAEIVHLDLSAASIEVARRRAAAAGLGNVRFVQRSLLDLPIPELGAFDYINCSGVLHHLENPAAGARALAAALKPDGGLSLMLYGELGRIGIYHVQDMMRLLRRDGDDLPGLIGLTRTLLDTLPSSNWLKRRHPKQPKRPDAEIVDMFLHVRDRPYRVRDVLELLAAAGLRLVSFIPPVRYDPLVSLKDAELRRRVEALPLADRCAFAELLHGGPPRHILFAVAAGRADRTVAEPGDPTAVPVLIEPVALPASPGAPLILRAGAAEVGSKLNPLGYRILSAIDGRRTIDEVFHHVAGTARPTVTRTAFDATFGNVYRLLNDAHVLMLTH